MLVKIFVGFGHDIAKVLQVALVCVVVDGVAGFLDKFKEVGQFFRNLLIQWSFGFI